MPQVGEMMEEEFQQQIDPCSLFLLLSPGAVLAPGCAGKITKLISLKWYAYCFDLIFLKIYFLFISERVPGLQVPPTESRGRCQSPWSWSYMSSLATLWHFWEPLSPKGRIYVTRMGSGPFYLLLLLFPLQLMWMFIKIVLEDILISYGVSKTQACVP